MRKNSYITVTDQFCGAGGSSQGVRMVANEQKLGTGLEVKLAMNHWKLAIQTHNTNFPNTDHVCTDISACDPRRYPSTNILITSPECTVHSPAGGGQAKKKMYGNQISLSGKLASEEAEERSRATMWDVCRFAEYHNYEIVIVENVIEARKWVLFDVWLQAMLNLGYNHEIKFINSKHAHPTPQSRDRMYCVFWKKGNKRPNLEFTPLAPCSKCLQQVHAIQWWKPSKKRKDNFGKYGKQYVYKCPKCNETVEPYFYAAFNVIDWSKPGTRIGDKRPQLKPKTLARCQYGIDKYWDEPSFINVKYSSGIDCRVKSLDNDALTTQPQEQAMSVLTPCIISSRYIQGISHRVKSSKEALPAQVTDCRESVLFPSLPTQTTQQSAGLLMPPPLILDGGWSEGKPRVDVTTKEPMATQDTGQTKGIITAMSFNSFLSYYNNTPQASLIREAMGTIATGERHFKVDQPYEKPRLEDCYYRMLLPHEIQLGMAFDPNYIVLGDSKQKVKQLGNAVTPPVMKFLVERCIETLL